MWNKIVDEKYFADQSLTLRYAHSGITNLNETDLLDTTLGEGERIFHLIDYKNIPIYILDETTKTATNTFEALVAHITIAYCKKKGQNVILSSSGGNLGTALAAYAKKSNIESYSFNPLSSLPLLDGSVFQGNAHCIAVNNAQQNREIMLKFREIMQKNLGFDPLVPTYTVRIDAFKFRGLYILEYMEKMGLKFSTITQTISAGFGPLGTYEAFKKFDDKKSKLPQFIGIQQATNCYMFERWSKTHTQEDGDLIIPTLFDKNPDKSFGTFNKLRDLIHITHGAITTINHKEFDDYITRDTLKKLSENGLEHTKLHNKIVARSGLVSLAGTIKAIDLGLVDGGPVLVCMGDGVRQKFSATTPMCYIKDAKEVATIKLK